MQVTDKSSEETLCSDCGAEVFYGICPNCAYADLIGESPSAIDVRDGQAMDCAFGRYQLKRRVAAGGMGVVYEAEDRMLKRTVALKMIRGSSFANADELARFTIEAEAAAGLDHPHIVPIYEVGSVEDQPFFTMRFIEGPSLAAMLADCPDRKLPAEKVAAFLSPIAQAVHHAHQRGVLHRDLKPANIVIDKAGKCWLTDFGLAKISHEDSGLTRSTDQLGTPNYMSPELVKGSAAAVSTASDVWALGVILWEMLCGKVPFSGANPVETMRHIVEEEPSANGEDRDILTLARRCLEKDPAKRLESAGAVAAELDRWLRGEPLQVRPVTAMERTAKWVQRRPVTSALIAGLALSLLLGGIGTAVFWQRAEAAVDSLTDGNAKLQQTLADSNAMKLSLEARLQIASNPQRALLLAVEAVESCEKQENPDPVIFNRSVEALYEILEKVGGHDISPSGMSLDEETVAVGETAATIPLPPCLSADSRWIVTFDATKIEKEGVVAALFDLHGAGEPSLEHRWRLWEEMGGPYLNQAHWLEDSQRLLSIDHHGDLRLWQMHDVDSPQSVVIGNVTQESSDTLYYYFPPNDVTRLSVLQWEKDNTELAHRRFRIDVSSEAVTEVDRHVIPRAIRSNRQYNISPDQRWVVGQLRRQHILADCNTPGPEAEVRILSDKVSMHLRRFSPDSRWLVSQEVGLEVTTCDLHAGPIEDVIASRFEVGTFGFFGFRFSFDADSTSTCLSGGTQAKIFPLGKPPADNDYRMVHQGISATATSHDGRWLAVGGGAGVVRVWPIEAFHRGAPPMEFRGMRGRAFAVQFTSDNASIIATGPAGVYRQWPFAGQSPGALPVVVPEIERRVVDIAVSSDSQWIATASQETGDQLDSEASYDTGNFVGEVRLSNEAGTLSAVLGTHRSRCTGVAFSRDDRWLASTGSEGVVKVWDLTSVTKAMIAGAAIPEPVHQLRMTDTKLLGGIIKHRMGRRRQLDFHPRGTLYVTSGSGVLFEWDLNASKPEDTVKAHFVLKQLSHLPDVKVSPDGKWLALGHYEDWPQPRGVRTQSVLLHDVSQPGAPKLVTELPGNFSHETDFDFTSDSRTLAAGASSRKSVCLWDLTSTDIAASRWEMPSAEGGSRLAFSKDDRWLAVQNSLGLHLWDWQDETALPRRLSRKQGTVEWIGNRHILMGLKGGHGKWDLDLQEVKQRARNLATSQ